jgi:hypothetical protein
LNSAAYFTSPEFLALTEGLPDAEVMLLGRAYHLEEAKVGILNRIVETSGASVVISSSWRLRHNLDELNEILAERGATFRASAVTPRVTSYEPSLTLRAREILAYIEALDPPPEAIVALDDDDLCGRVPGHLRTDAAFGLEERHVEMCLRILGGAGV